MAQPPLGGCVLKLTACSRRLKNLSPAAFRRLCVETSAQLQNRACRHQPPLGGCVLKPDPTNQSLPCFRQPPLGGCVLKPHEKQQELESNHASRL